MFQQEAKRFRRELDQVGVRRGLCFPQELRVRVTAWITTQRAAGVSVEVLASELGLSRGTVMKWSQLARASEVRAMVPVHVVADRVESTVSVASPSGYRIEGLSLVEAVAVLKELG